MREHLADLVYPTVALALDYHERVGRGEPLDLDAVQAELRDSLKPPSQAAAWPDYGGDGDRFLGIQYALVCWIDEIFITDSPWGEDWNEKKLEDAFYKTNDRAWKFWVQARLAQARAGGDAVEAYYLCVMLGFRGEGPEPPLTLPAWRDAVENQLADGWTRKWDGPQERPVEPVHFPRRAAEKVRKLALGLIVLVALVIPAAGFYVAYLLKG